MSNKRVIISRDKAELAEKLAILISARIMENPKNNLVLTVGATPSQTYKNLANLANRGIIDLRKCNFILYDEFLADNNSELPLNPHYHELHTTFFSLANISSQRIIRPKGEGKEEQALSMYTEQTGLRKPTIMILGVSPSGSIGWNTVHDLSHPSPHSLSISDRHFTQNHGYEKCITLSAKQIMEADLVVLLAVARNKGEIVKKIVEDKEGATLAGHILHHHPNAFLFLDTKSAALLHLSPSPSVVKGYQIINDANMITEKKVICFSPHPDDTSISAGASLALLSSSNTVISCCATTGHRAYIPNTTREQRIKIREDEATKEARLLGASAHFLRLPLYDRGSLYSEDDLKIMFEYLAKERPDLIFLPHTGDSHPTHRAVLYTILQSLSKLASEQSYSCDLYMYEGPWSLFPSKTYNTIISPPNDCFDQKMAAIKAHTSQTSRTPYDRAADSLALLRGSLVPEQDLSGFGEEPPRLEDRIELFYHIQVTSPTDIQLLLSYFNDEVAPRNPK